MKDKKAKDKEHTCWDCGKPIKQCDCGIEYCSECGEEIGVGLWAGIVGGGIRLP